MAAGRLDGFWEDDLDLWDIAAGILLVREAGGFVTDFRGADRVVRARRISRRQSARSTRKLHKLVAGALSYGRFQWLRACAERAVLKPPPSFKPRSFPLATVAAGYLPILLFLGVALGLSSAFVVLPMIVAAADRRAQALSGQARRI